MTILLIRNRVRDFDAWKKVFDANRKVGEKYGLVPQQMWRQAGDENNVFFTMTVKNIDRAVEFMNLPESQEAGEKSGVIEGEFYFLQESRL